MGSEDSKLRQIAEGIGTQVTEMEARVSRDPAPANPPAIKFEVSGPAAGGSLRDVPWWLWILLAVIGSLLPISIYRQWWDVALGIAGAMITVAAFTAIYLYKWYRPAILGLIVPPVTMPAFGLVCSKLGIAAEFKFAQTSDAVQVATIVAYSLLLLAAMLYESDVFRRWSRKTSHP